MKFAITFFSLGLLLVLASAVFDINYFNYQRPIPYSGWDKITFYDFKGLNRPFSTLDGGKKFAFIRTNREVRIQGEGIVEITTYFHPSRSYVFMQDIRSADLLRHELYHFHIAEYCSRLYRQEIASLRNPVSSRLLAALSQKYDLFEGELQEKYDDDTYHSYVLQQQKKWEADIDEKLKALEDFSNPAVQLKTNQ